MKGKGRDKKLSSGGEDEQQVEMDVFTFPLFY